MASTRMRAKGQLTIPSSVAKAANLREGDYLDVEVVDGGIMLRPCTLVPTDQAWFWTEEWQAGEREASEDIAAGRVERFNSDEEFLASLD